LRNIRSLDRGTRDDPTERGRGVRRVHRNLHRSLHRSLRLGRRTGDDPTGRGRGVRRVHRGKLTEVVIKK
jgi:hypothetical protein